MAHCKANVSQMNKKYCESLSVKTQTHRIIHLVWPYITSGGIGAVIVMKNNRCDDSAACLLWLNSRMFTFLRSGPDKEAALGFQIVRQPSGTGDRREIPLTLGSAH